MKDIRSDILKKQRKMGKASVVEVFEDCQKGLHSHGKLVKRLGKIYKSVSFYTRVQSSILDQ